jgi:small-conductance mechanosensitive channel
MNLRAALSLGRLWTLLGAALIFIHSVAPLGAQTAPPQEKIDRLIELLSDPQIKTWLEERSKAPPDPAPEAQESGIPTLSTIIASIRNHIQKRRAAIPTIPAQFERMRNILAVEFQEEGVLGLLLLVAGFLAAGYGADQLARYLLKPYRKWMTSFDYLTPRGRLKGFGARALYLVMVVLAFTVGSAGFFLIFEWPPLLKEIVLGFLSAGIAARIVAMFGRLILMPPSLGLKGADDVRLPQMSGERAQHWYRYTWIFATIIAFTFVIMSLLKTFGFDEMSCSALGIPVDTVLLILALIAVWTRPASAATFTGLVSPKAMSWFLTAFFLVLWLLRFAGAMTAFWVVLAAVALPALLAASHRAIIHYLRPPEPGHEGEPIPPVTVAVVDRGIRVALILVAAWLLARAWGFEFDTMAGDTTVQRLLRGGLKAAVILLAADFAWSLIKALIDRKLGDQMGPAHGHAAVDPRQQRLKTLLPIFRNILFVVLIVIAALMALSSLGIEIGPLIAGAGIAGVAIGFGAQTLVKDIISGMFYLLDDAFRVGEYIESGSYRGTVESFSLRSIKLRHHRGYLFTVPFGELGAVQNMSRDWVIDKFSVSVGYDTDVDKAKKLVKKIGQTLAQDPEHKPHIIEPLKMQGVNNFGDYGIELRMKMMTKPGEQFVIRRKAWLMIKKAFEENGITFASPSVQVRGGEGGAAAAAQEMIDLAKEKAAPLPST